MSKKKYSYYVGVLTGEGCKFVTSLNYAHKYARWEDGKPALEMSMGTADDLVLGLLLNFHYAFTIKVPNGVTFHNAEVLKNDKE